MELSKIYSDEEILNTNPLLLAFVGDAVFTLYVREKITSVHQTNVSLLSKMASSVVNAGNQYKMFRKIEPELTDFEKDVAHRARNANIHSKAKNYSVTEYIYATAFEAIIGYLYLTNKKERLEQILKLSWENVWN